MSLNKRRILFVSHAASMTGAPLIFLGMIREFRQQSDIPFQILIFEDGPLTEQFQALGKTFVWNRNKRKGFLSRIIQLIRGLYILFCIRKNSLLFFNTIANGHLHKKLLFLKAKTVCYVHELESAIHMITNSETLGIVLNNTDFFFTGSVAVKANLVNNHRIDPAIIKVCYSSLTEVSRDKRSYEELTRKFKQENNIPDNAIIAGVAGTSEWRKGFDLFHPLVCIYRKLYPENNVFFVWKGYKASNAFSLFYNYDIRKFELNDRVLLLPHGSDSIECIATFDIHLLLSREDPYPLVVLEAASFGIPTVSFLNAGGSPEFIEQDSGICVPYGDLIEMASALHQLATNAELRNKMGKSGQEKVKAGHDQKDITQEIISVINSL